MFLFRKYLWVSTEYIKKQETVFSFSCFGNCRLFQRVDHTENIPSQFDIIVRLDFSVPVHVGCRLACNAEICYAEDYTSLRYIICGVDSAVACDIADYDNGESVDDLAVSVKQNETVTGGYISACFCEAV